MIVKPISPTSTWARVSVAGMVTAAALTACAPSSMPSNGASTGLETVGADLTSCLTDQGWEVSHVSADGFQVEAGLPVDQQDDVQLAWSECVGTPATYSVPLPG